jgi:hypothetical protein
VNVITKDHPIAELNTRFLNRALRTMKAFINQIYPVQSTNSPIPICRDKIQKYEMYPSNNTKGWANTALECGMKLLTHLAWRLNRPGVGVPGVTPCHSRWKCKDPDPTHKEGSSFWGSPGDHQA